MIDAIIFDMDGTLVDNVRVITDAWNQSIKMHNMGMNLTINDVRSVMGMSASDIAEKFFHENPKKNDYINIIATEEIEYLKEHKGDTYIPNEEFLKQLSQKYDLYIVSNCLAGYIESFLTQFHYEKYFKGFLDNRKGKTKSENIKEIVKKYNLKNPLYVGDTIIDYNSCKEANINFLHAAYGYGKVDNVKKINNITELLNLEELYEKH